MCSAKKGKLLRDINTENNLFFTLFIFFLVLASRLAAQDSSHLWTLQDCFDYARAHNIALEILRKDIDINHESLLQARAALLPDLTGSSSQSFTNSKNANPVIGGFETQSSFASKYGLSTSLIIYQGGSLKNNILSQQLNTQAANLNVSESMNNLTIQITQSYLNILLAKENITALENVVTTSEAQYNNGQVLFDAGSIAKNDLVQLKATLATDKFNLVTAGNQLRQNILSLKQILELPTGYNFRVPEQQHITVPQSYPDLQTVVDSAVQSRPEVKIGQNAVAQANVQLREAHAGGLPTVSAGASLSSGYSNQQSSKYLSQLDNNFFQQVGVTVGIPIFNNRETKTNVAKSKIAIDQSELSLKDTKLALSEQVEQSYINLINAEAQYKAAQDQFEANDENYRVANERLKLGAANMVDFLVQKNQFIQAQQALIQAKYSVLLNHGIYEFYMGRPITLNQTEK